MDIIIAARSRCVVSRFAPYFNNAAFQDVSVGSDDSLQLFPAYWPMSSGGAAISSQLCPYARSCSMRHAPYHGALPYTLCRCTRVFVNVQARPGELLRLRRRAPRAIDAEISLVVAAVSSLACSLAISVGGRSSEWENNVRYVVLASRQRANLGYL